MYKKKHTLENMSLDSFRPSTMRSDAQNKSRTNNLREIGIGWLCRTVSIGCMASVRNKKQRKQQAKPGARIVKEYLFVKTQQPKHQSNNSSVPE